MTRFWRFIKSLFYKKKVKHNCCKCQKNYTDDDLGDRVIKEMWNKDMRYNKRFKK